MPRVNHVAFIGMAALVPVVGATIAFGPTVPAHADDLWIAVAVSESSGESATQSGYTNVAAAQAARNDCNRIGHVYDCQLLAFGQGGCVATATPGFPNTIRGAWAASRQEAIVAALAQVPQGSRARADCLGDPGLQQR